jgi:hypothetical protein
MPGRQRISANATIVIIARKESLAQPFSRQRVRRKSAPKNEVRIDNKLRGDIARTCFSRRYLQAVTHFICVCLSFVCVCVRPVAGELPMGGLRGPRRAKDFRCPFSVSIALSAAACAFAHERSSVPMVDKPKLGSARGCFTNTIAIVAGTRMPRARRSLVVCPPSSMTASVLRTARFGRDGGQNLVS